MNMDVVQWPQRTSQWCYHCAHPFEHRPIPHAKYFDRKNNVFVVQRYVCCSWQCVKALSDLGDHAVVLMFRRCTGHWPREGVSAQKPSVLRAFGGTIDIETYRQGFCHTFNECPPMVYVVPRQRDGVYVLGNIPKMIPQGSAVTGAKVRTPRNGAKLQNVEFAQSPGSKVDQLKLKRTKQKENIRESHHDILNLIKPKG